VTSVPTAPPAREFDWQPQPEGQAVVTGLIGEVLGLSAFGKGLVGRMRDVRGARCGDWVAHIEVPSGHAAFELLGQVGFVSRGDIHLRESFVHTGPMLPTILRSGNGPLMVRTKVDRPEELLAAHGTPTSVAYEPAPHADTRGWT